MGGAVELAGVERKTTDHGDDAAGVRVHRHQPALDLGDLAKVILACLAGVGGLDVDHITDVEHVARRLNGRALLLAGRPLGPFHLAERNGAGVAFRLDRIGAGLASRLETDGGRIGAERENDRKAPLDHVGQRRDIRELGTPIVAEIVDVGDRTAPALVLVKLDQAVNQGLARHDLYGRL